MASFLCLRDAQMTKDKIVEICWIILRDNTTFVVAKCVSIPFTVARFFQLAEGPVNRIIGCGLNFIMGTKKMLGAGCITWCLRLKGAELMSRITTFFIYKKWKSVIKLDHLLGQPTFFNGYSSPQSHDSYSLIFQAWKTSLWSSRATRAIPTPQKIPSPSPISCLSKTSGA